MLRAQPGDQQHEPQFYEEIKSPTDLNFEWFKEVVGYLQQSFSSLSSKQVKCYHYPAIERTAHSYL
jgi:hypothetical protein